MRGDFQEAAGEGPKFELPKYLAHVQIEKTGEKTYIITFQEPLDPEHGNVLLSGVLRQGNKAAGTLYIEK